MASLKGKEVAKGKDSSGKRKRDGGQSDKSGQGRKRKNPGVLQFFEDTAYVVDEDDADDDDSDLFGDDFLEDEFDTEVQVKNEPGKVLQLPFIPKEEELSGDELEKMLEERYRAGSGFVAYAEDVYDSKRSNERNIVMDHKYPTIWKVKCMVGRERHSAFCLMQKYVDLQSLGTKLQIISAFALDHVKGFIYIEAERQHDVHEACKGLCTMYWSRVTPVPKNEMSHLLSVRSKYNEVSRGTWARVKNGKYKGDLAQVIHVNDGRKKATVKLIPRIDLQLMSEKFGGGAPSKKDTTSGVASKKIATPAPRLISSIELEEFLPLMQQRRDRDTGLVCHFLNGLMLKDGYLYKKVSVDSLSFWGVTPTEEEHLKFESSQQEESDNQEWLFQLYGEQKKKPPIKRNDKCGGKGEGSSCSGMMSSFEVHDLVFFGRNDFGVVVGTEKDDTIKILKDGSEGPVVVTVESSQLKSGSFDRKFTALDNLKKMLLVNDTVRVLDGPLQGRQGVVKLIYRGTIFMHDENELENSGYICFKSHRCEKIKLSDGTCKGKGDETEPSGFNDFESSPETPLSPKRPWEMSENNSKFNQGDKDGMFSIGQSLRIRVGPLKGYLCRVLALRRSDVTVKLDSQQKVLTVKSEHLSEVRGKSSAFSLSDDVETVKPFDLLGTQDCSGDWMAGVGTSADGERWGAGGLSTERSSWPAFPPSSFTVDLGSTSTNPLNLASDDANKGVGDAAWDSRPAPNGNSSWNKAASDEKAAGSSEQVGGWAKSENNWKKTNEGLGFGGSTSDAWGRAKLPCADNGGLSKDGDKWDKPKLRNAGSSNDAEASWGKRNVENTDNSDGCGKSDEPWDKGKSISDNPRSSWGSATAGKSHLDAWGKGTSGEAVTSSWGKAVESLDKGTGEEAPEGSRAACRNESGGWGNSNGNLPNLQAQDGSWKRAISTDGGQTERWGNVKQDAGAMGFGNSRLGSGKALDTQDTNKNMGTHDDSWGKAAESWVSKGGSSGSKAVSNNSTAAPEKQTGGWCNVGGSPSDNLGGGSSWNKSVGGSSWNTHAGGSSFDGWNKSRTEDKDDVDQHESWNKGKTFDGGCASGGRRGRGGSRGGRGNWGGRGGSSGWGLENQEYDSKQSLGTWGKGDGGNDRSSWAKTVDSSGKGTDEQTPNDSWGKATEKWGSGDGFGGKTTWNSSVVGPEKDPEGKDQGDSWTNKTSNGGSQWDRSSKWKDGSSDAGRDQDSGWGRNWSSGNDSQGKPSGWNQRSASNEKDLKGRDQGDGWTNKSSNDGSGTGWSQSSKWKNDEKDAGGSQDSGWGNKSWDSGNIFSGNENQSDSYGDRERGGGWRGGRGSSDRGGYRGRGGSDRGGYRGRGGSERGGFGGRGGSDRGGFRGRGGSERGSFGRRGRGRGSGSDDNGDWKPRNSYGEDRCSSWKKESNNGAEGWKRNDGEGYGNQVGGDRVQRQGWSSGWNSSKGDTGGRDTDASARGRTKGAGSAMDTSGNDVDTGGWNSQASGWSKGSSSGWSGGGSSAWNKSNDADGPQASGWSKGGDSGGSGGGSGTWNKSNDAADGQQASGWSKGGGSGGGGGGSGAWNKSNDAADGPQASGWSKGGSSGGSGGGSGTWNKSNDVADGQQASCWGKGGDSGGSGGGLGTWNKSNDAADGLQASGWSMGGGLGGSGGGSGTWNKSNDADGSQASGWSKGGGSSGSGSGGGLGTWVKSHDAADAQQALGWSKGGGSSGSGGGSGTWNRSNDAAAGQQQQASGWSKRGGSGDSGGLSGFGNESNNADGGSGGLSGAWNKSNNADGFRASGWNQHKDTKIASASGGSGDPWGKAAASSWGKGNDGGSSQGGW